MVGRPVIVVILTSIDQGHREEGGSSTDIKPSQEANKTTDGLPERQSRLLMAHQSTLQAYMTIEGPPTHSTNKHDY